MVVMSLFLFVFFCSFFFFKQKTAYEMRISDWSSDVCSSDLGLAVLELDLEPADDRTADHEWLGRADHAFRPLGIGRREDLLRGQVGHKIGRASCRERVCQYV